MTIASSLRAMQPPLCCGAHNRRVTGRLTEGTQPQHMPYSRDSNIPIHIPSDQDVQGSEFSGAFRRQAHSRYQDNEGPQQEEKTCWPFSMPQEAVGPFTLLVGPERDSVRLQVMQLIRGGQDSGPRPGSAQGGVLPCWSPPLRQQGKRTRLGAVSQGVAGCQDNGWGVAKPDGKRQLEICPQPEGQSCPPAAVAVLSLCACPLSRAVTILTHLLVAAGSEIVARWEQVMSTSPLSNTFPGNLAGATRLQGPRQGRQGGHRDVEGGGLTRTRPYASLPTSPTARQVSLRTSLRLPAQFLSVWSLRPSSHLPSPSTPEGTTSELLKMRYWFPQRGYRQGATSIGRALYCEPQRSRLTTVLPTSQLCDFG